MRYFIALTLMLLAQTGWAQDWEDQRLFNDPAPTTLRIISSTDTDLFAPLIEAFVVNNPDVSIQYLVTGTADLDRRFRDTPDAFDIVISSAMDLQLKLTNDGFARALDSVAHPAWAHWRQSLFAFTSEPAAIGFNRAAFDGLPIPRTRQELIKALRDRPDVFRGRIGTYDVRKSGLGYLFATQDARASETFWRLMEVMGGLDVRLYCCSGEMIDDLTDGTIAVAYNVLSSYAAAQVESHDSVEFILPSDFPTTMMRTALVSQTARFPDKAELFIQHLIKQQSNGNEQSRSLPPFDGAKNGASHVAIALEPALLTFLDTLKRSKFVSEWESALIQN